MARKQHRGEVTADLLLDAALRLYAESGEQGVTVGAVTRASGVSLGSLYHHFGSLDGLLDALARRWLRRLLDALATAVAGRPTAREGIEAMVGAYLGFVGEHREAARLLHSPRADRQAMAAGPELRAAQEARLEPLGRWLAAHLASGEIAPLPPAVLEALVLGPVVAVARRRLAGFDDVDLDEAARVLPDRIWRSVAGDAHRPAP
ncbi:TetR/AcrR family transcriptional regulator [Streptomyces sp. SCSIO 75703]|uniref:TetR/AcrR family transcriptional regulator n=1 Tax=unclassified Streptomyces TaxID=2593676 RepID=UPI0004C288DB|nr:MULTISPECIES: TetR/AcrR family transcriptional regulator [unclassified Streptomyces]